MTPAPTTSALASPAATAAHTNDLHIPDFGIAGVLDWFNTHVSGIFTFFLVLYLIVIFVKLVRGDDVEFLGLFKSSRKLQETRRALSDMTLLVRGHGILFKSIESTLRRRSQLVSGGARAKEDALSYLCDWLPRGISFGRTADAQKIVFWVPDGTDLVVRASAGLSPESVPQMRFPINPADPRDDTFAAMAFRYKIPYVSGDVKNDPRYETFNNLQPSHPYRSILAVPTFGGNDVVGVLTLDSLHANAFGIEEVGLAQLFASLFADFI